MQFIMLQTIELFERGANDSKNETISQAFMLIQMNLSSFEPHNYQQKDHV